MITTSHGCVIQGYVIQDTVFAMTPKLGPMYVGLFYLKHINFIPTVKVKPG